MPQATEIDFASATAGLFIAPKATVTGLGGTSSGWIVVNSFTNNGGEWHCVYGELPKPENVEKPAQESFSETINYNPTRRSSTQTSNGCFWSNK